MTDNEFLKEFVPIVELSKEYSKKKDYDGLIKLGFKIMQLLNKSTYIENNDEVNNTFKKIVGAYLTKKDVDDALEWISEIGALNEDLKYIKQKLQVIKKLKKGLLIKKIEDAYLLRRLGKLHKELEALSKAYDIYYKSLEIDPNNIYGLNGIGGVCNKDGKLDKAIEYYSQALEVEENIVSFTGLGATYRDYNEHDLAIYYYTRALEMDRVNAYANNGIGAVYFDLGKYDLGEKHFGTAGFNIKYLLGLSKSYISKDMIENGIECLKLILRIDPDHKKARHLLDEYQDADLED